MEVKLDNIKAYQSLPTIKSTDVQWMKWSDDVMNQFGANLGKQIFLTAWTKRGSQAANTVAFRKHIKDNYNLEVDESLWNKVADLGGGIADSIGKIVRVGKVTFFVVGGLLLVTAVVTVVVAVKGKATLVRGLIKGGGK